MSANKLFIILLSGFSLDDQYEETPKCSEMLNTAKSLDPADQYASLRKGWLPLWHLGDFRLEINDELFHLPCFLPPFLHGQLNSISSASQGPDTPHPFLPAGSSSKATPLLCFAAPSSISALQEKPQNLLEAKPKYYISQVFCRRISQCIYIYIYVCKKPLTLLTSFAQLPRASPCWLAVALKQSIFKTYQNLQKQIYLVPALYAQNSFHR